MILHIDNWEHIKLISPGFKGFYFRGMSESSMDLKSPLERSSTRWGVPRDILPIAEERILFDFKRRASNYYHPVPSDGSVLEWWALLRHFEGPARFLDFTKSFFIAAYFALANSTTEAAIWAVSKRSLDTFEEIAFPELRKLGTFHERVTFKEKEVYPYVFSRNYKYRGVVASEPFVLNNRMRVQQGLFLIPFSLAEPFEHHFFAALELPPSSFREDSTISYTYRNILDNSISLSDFSLIKIILPPSIHSKAVCELNDMNITAESLFPGLDGLAKTLEIPFAMYSSWFQDSSKVD